MEDKMQKAWRLHAYAGPSSLQLDTIPIPSPSPSQVLVKIHLAAINPMDWKVCLGWYESHLPLRLPQTLGVDFVGTVAVTGSSDSKFVIGERVMAMSRSLDAFAEYNLVEEADLARVPVELDDEVAATLPLPALTAWQAVFDHAGPITPGMKVLVHGASGATGALAVQFAKAEGAVVVGTASGRNRGYVMELGAQGFVDYQTEDFEEKVKDVDLVVDCVLVAGDRNTTDRSWSVLKPGGAVVTVTDPSIVGKTPQGFRGYFFQTAIDTTLLEQVGAKVAAGEIRTKVAKVFTRSELIKALEVNRAGGTAGRVLVDMQRD